MAFDAVSIWECQTGGGASDTLNGGGFSPLTTNMATDLAATSGTTTTPVLSSASYNFVSLQDAGHWVFVGAGTNWNTGWFKISSVASNAATVDGTIGAWIDKTTYAPSTTQGAVTASYVSATASGTWSLDYSQSTTVALTLTITATTTFTSTPAVGKNFVGNILFLSNAGATGATVQRYEVVSTSGTTATVDKTFAVSSGTPTTVNLGGPLASPGQAGALGVTGNKLFIKSGTYTVTSATANIAAGCLAWVGNTAASDAGIVGYGSLRGDFGTKPLMQASGIATFTLLTVLNNGLTYVANMSLDGASLTSSRGFNVGTKTFAYRCKAINCKNNAFTSPAAATAIVLCEATGCATAAAYATGGIACTSHDNTIAGFAPGNSGQALVFCVSSNNTGVGFDMSVTAAYAIGSISYGNSSHGFSGISNTSFTCINCLSVNNGGYGFTASGLNQCALLVNCAGCSNTSGNINTAIIQPQNSFGFVTLNTGATSATVSAAGSGYAVGDILTLTGGTSAQTATFKVATLSGSGVATVTVVRPGSYSATPANAAATTHVTGSGNDACTLTVTYNGNIVFNNAAGNDFSLSNVPGAGGACRQAGIPGALAANQLPGLSTLSYPAIGAAVPVYPLSGGMGGGYSV